MYKIARTLHNWLGIILATQIMLWFVSGLVMALLPIQEVRGTHLRKLLSANWLDATYAPASILNNHTKEANLALSQRATFDGESPVVVPIFSVTDGDKTVRYNANTGAVVSPLTEAEIRNAGKAQYRGDGNLVSALKLTELPQEVQHLSVPIWQLQFNDEDNTRLYIEPETGSVISVRTDTWRLFDLMWMLHIMDYKDRSNFNHPVLIAFSGGSALFTLTGILLLWQRFRPRKRRLFK